MLSQQNSQAHPNNPKIIIFPEGNNILATSDTSQRLANILKTEVLSLQIALDNFIASVKNIKAAIEIIKYYLDSLPSTKDYVIFKQNIMVELLNNYKYEEFVGNKLLEKYKIRKLSENTFIYKIDGTFYSSELIQKKIPESDFYENKFLKIVGMYSGVYAAIKNAHKKTAEELIKETLKTADLDLSLFLARGYPKYNESTMVISEMISLLEPKSRIYAFKILEKYWQQNFNALSNFSNTLLSQKYFDEVVELLETKLETVNINDTVLGNEHIGNCYYNLGLAYYNKVNYELAKKYYLSALEYIPNDQDTFLELYKIYLKTNEREKAKNIVNNLPYGDIKNLLEMSVDLAEVTTAKLKSINKNILPKDFYSLIQNLEYIGKFNEEKFSSSNKISAFQKLLKNCDDNSALLSTALYTKQYNFAEKILQKIPEKEIFQSKLLWKYKTLVESEFNHETSQIIIDNNNLQGSEAANIINISSFALIANGEFIAVSKTVENALQYDPNNEDTLEIGIAAALLNNNKEKTREYASQLSEEKQQEIATNYSKNNNAENIDELIEQYDSKEIHAYYQRLKQQKLLEIGQKITNNQIISNWDIDKQKITKNDVIFIGKYKGLNCFAKIEETVKKKLDINLIDSFTRVMEKGITYCKTSINGVKFLQNKVVEVKFDGDMRLYTNIIYKNFHEELLINFDQYGNHNEVTKFANHHYLEILGNLDAP